MNNRKDTAVQPAQTFVDTCRSTFGNHPGDVIAPLKCASETLTQLHEILVTIRDEALDERKGFRIKALAEAGAYLAFEIGNYAGYEFERSRDSLVAAGVLKAECCHE